MDMKYNFVGQDDITQLLERMDRIVSRLDRNFDSLGIAAKRAGKGIDEAEDQVEDLGDEMGKTTRKTEEFGESLVAAGVSASQLDAKLAATRLRIKELGKEFDATGDKKILIEIFDEKKEKDKLDRVKKLMKDVAAAGEQAGRLTLRSIGDALAALPAEIRGAVIVGATAAAIAASPFIAGTIAAAVVGGVGIGGIVGGIALAAQDPAVEAAANAVGGRIANAFKPIGAGFVKPVITALEVGAVAAERFAKNLDLTGVAKEIPGLAQGISDFSVNIMPGLNRALEASKPLLRVIARELPQVASALSDALTKISGQSDGAVLALTALFKLIEGGTRMAGDGIAYLAGMMKSFLTMAEYSGKVMGAAWGWLPILGDRIEYGNKKVADLKQSLDLSKISLDANATSTGALATSMRIMANAAAAATQNLNDWATAGHNSRLAALDAADAVAGLSKSVKENGTTLDETKEKGRANLRVIEAGIAAADNAGKAAENRALKEGKSAEAAAAAGAMVRERWISALLDAAAKAGLNIDKVKDLVKEYQAADGTTLTLYQDTILRTYNAGPTPYVPNRGGSGKNKRKFLAAGGPTPIGEDFVVGEEGPEVLRLTRPGYVIPNHRVAAATHARSMSERDSGAPQEILVRVRLEYPDGRVAVEQIQRMARQSGQRTLTQVFDMAAG